MARHWSRHSPIDLPKWLKEQPADKQHTQKYTETVTCEHMWGGLCGLEINRAKYISKLVCECTDGCVNKLVSPCVHTFCIYSPKTQSTTHAFLKPLKKKAGSGWVHLHAYMHPYLWAFVCVNLCMYVWNPLAGSPCSVGEYIPGKPAATPVITANSIRGASAA